MAKNISPKRRTRVKGRRVKEQKSPRKTKTGHKAWADTAEPLFAYIDIRDRERLLGRSFRMWMMKWHRAAVSVHSSMHSSVHDSSHELSTCDAGTSIVEDEDVTPGVMNPYEPDSLSAMIEDVILDADQIDGDEHIHC